jgi:hypothetical protein
MKMILCPLSTRISPLENLVGGFLDSFLVQTPALLPSSRIVGAGIVDHEETLLLMLTSVRNL